MKYELVIFDCDGVLVDSEPLANQVLRDGLAREGLDLSLSEVVSEFVGLSMSSVVSRAEQLLGHGLPEDFLDRVQAETFEVFHRELTAVEGIHDVVAHLREQGIRSCVASSGDFAKMEVTLGLTGLKEDFDGRIFSSSQVSRGKPWPDLYLFAAERMGIDPALCLVVEDSLPGVRGAVAAGMDVLAYSVRGECDDLLKAGGVVIHRMTEVLDHLG
ncbi:HAD family hydrolase [Emcibacter sp.]|uniref:HAD family hydrolase n=1 Tax=Emcibacter sp. TaxID=1979954 RepID=UPI002AA83086|nr:HAD family hydrolase [Emcibacter sp.]